MMMLSNVARVAGVALRERSRQVVPMVDIEFRKNLTKMAGWFLRFAVLQYYYYASCEFIILFRECILHLLLIS